MIIEGDKSLSRLTEEERRFAKGASERGWIVFRKGWPDFFILKDKVLMGIEIKKKGQVLSESQEMMQKAFIGSGLPYIISFGGDPEILGSYHKEES